MRGWRGPTVERLQTREPNSPAWWGSPAVNEWVVVPGSDISAAGVAPSPVPPSDGGGSKYVVEAYSGFCVSSGGDLYLFGGGHSNYSGNEVYRLRCGVASPAWARVSDPTPNAQIATLGAGVGYYADGKPGSRHTYANLAFDDVAGKMRAFGATATWADAATALYCDALDSTALTWSQFGTLPAWINTSFVSTCEDRATGTVYFTGKNDTYEIIAGQWTSGGGFSLLKNSGQGGTTTFTPSALDTLRMRLWRFGAAGGAAKYFDLGASANYVDPTLSGAAASTFDAIPEYGACCYADNADAIYHKPATGATLYKLDCATNTCIQVTTTGVTPADGNGFTCKKLQYVPALGGLIYMPKWGPVYYLKTA